MTQRGRIIVSVMAGIAAAVGAAFPFLQLLMFPGLLVASIFWPQGVHTSGMGTTGAVLMILTIYGGTAAFWGGLTYALLRRRSTSAPSAS